MSRSLTLIPGSTGTPFGSFTGSSSTFLGFGGLAKAFDGTNVKVYNSGTSGNIAGMNPINTNVTSYVWIGKDLGTPIVIGGCKTYGVTAGGVASGYDVHNSTDQYVFNLMASNTSPTGLDKGIWLGSVYFVGTGSIDTQTILSADTTTPYRYVWITITHYATSSHADQQYAIAQLEFYTTP